jgi:hypothetical protein
MPLTATGRQRAGEIYAEALVYNVIDVRQVVRGRGELTGN